jgi:hypothetical protein
MPPAPAAALPARFPDVLADTLLAAEVELRFIEAELAEMAEERGRRQRTGA